MTGIPPTDPRLTEMTIIERGYFLHWLVKVQREKEGRLVDRLGELLGVVWHLDDFAPANKKVQKKVVAQDTLLTPLSELLEKDIRKRVSRSFSQMAGQDKADVELGTVPYKDYKAFRSRLPSS